MEPSNNKIRIAPDLDLPLDIATRRSAILGVSGSGKTNTAKVMVEQLLGAGVQVAIIDPLDGWWGLKSTADGQSPAFPITVLGGEHQDAPLPDTAGGAVASWLVSTRAPAVLSLRHMKKAGQRRFITDLATELYDLKGQPGNRTPICLVIDECDLFMPQKVFSGLEHMVGAMDDLARRGRSSGIGMVMISQRAAVVNKDVLSQVEILIAHLHTGVHDRKALDEWVNQFGSVTDQNTFSKTITELGQGQAWVWSPSWLQIRRRVQVTKAKTYDSTKTPEIGIEPEQVNVAKVDMEDLRRSLAATIEQAERQDPRLLLDRIQKLEAEAKSQQDPKAVADMKLQLGKMAHAMCETQVMLAGAMKFLAPWTANVTLDAITDTELTVMQSIGDPNQFRPGPDMVARPIDPPDPAPGPTADGLNDGQQRILDALAKYRVLGVQSLQKTNLAVLSSHGRKSSGYDQKLRDLKSRGLVDLVALGTYKITPEGIKLANAPKVPGSLEELHRAWIKTVPAAQGRMLSVLVACPERKMHKMQLAKATNQSLTSSGWDKNLRELRLMGAIRMHGTIVVEVTDMLFPAGMKIRAKK